jgi:hypothetical protein
LRSKWVVCEARGQLAVFPRCSLDRYDPDSGASLAALKNSQLTCGETQGISGTLAVNRVAILKSRKRI